jgi:predicted TPR repeat methyltransferase
MPCPVAPHRAALFLFSAMLDKTVPNDPFTQELQRILQLIDQGQLQPAALALNQAQRRSPQDARVLLVGVQLTLKAGNLDGAIQAARRALALAPRWPMAMLGLGALLIERGQKDEEKDEAMRLASSAVAREPDDPDVLCKAADIASDGKQKEQAFAWRERALALRPDDAQLRFILGRNLFELKRHADAKPHFEWLEQRFPNEPDVLLGLMDCALAASDSAAAQSYADRALAVAPDDPNVQYWHAVAHERTPPTQSAAAITSVFDDYAQNFDMHLVRGLKYKVPERVAQMLLALYPNRKFNLLDLGCGTGLLGVYLGPIQGHIIGVDLSPEMIKQAARHQVYSRFYSVNVLDALRDTPAEHYEVITCLDTLVYVGDLTPVIPGALRILKPGGYFIFSCEAAQEGEPDLVLRLPSHRYAHRDTAVQRMCREAGFTDIQVEQLPTLRLEGETPLPGFLVTAQKPGEV